MINDKDLAEWDDVLNHRPDDDLFFISRTRLTTLIAEVRRLREQLKPDCVNGCIVKLARETLARNKP